MMQARLDKLISNLQHSLPEIRRRSLKNLTFKVSSGLILPERIISDVVATRSFISILKNPATEPSEMSDVLHLLELIVTKDSWSAAVLVDAGALNVVQSLVDKSDSFESKITQREFTIDKNKQLKNLTKILLSVPPQNINKGTNLDVTSDNYLNNNKAKFSPSPIYRGSKVGRAGSRFSDSLPPRDTKRSESPDHFKSMMATTTTSTNDKEGSCGLSIRGGWCFPQVNLTRHDDQVLFQAKAELSCGDPIRQMNVLQQLSTVTFFDFPGEIWLQRPEIFRMILTLIRSTKESDIPSDTLMLECTVQCLEILLHRWKNSLKKILDHELNPTITSSQSSSIEYSTSPEVATYPSGHAGTIVFTPTSSSTSSISLGDAALAIVMSSFPTPLCRNNKHNEILEPILSQAMSFVSECFPIHHMTRDGQIVDHTSWTASRYQKIIDTMNTMVLQFTEAATPLPTPHYHQLHLTYCRLLSNLLLEVASSGITIVRDTTASSKTSVQVSTPIVDFVRQSIFCSGDLELDIDDSVWSTLENFMESVDNHGTQLMEISKNILSAVRAARDEYCGQKNNENAEDGSATKGVNERSRNMFLKYARSFLSNDVGSDSENVADKINIAEICRRRYEVLVDLLPSLMCMRTTTDEIMLGDKISLNLPVINISIMKSIVGDVVFLCGLVHMLNGEGIEILRQDAVGLLVSLMSYPFPQVQLFVYEQLLSSITLRTLSSVGADGSSVSLSSTFVNNVMVQQVLNNECVMNEIVFQGLNNKIVRTYAIDLARLVLILTSKGVSSCSSNNSNTSNRSNNSKEGMERLHKYIPVLFCLPEQQHSDMQKSAQQMQHHENRANIFDPNIIGTMNLRDRALLLLQALTHQNKSIRHQASVDLRRMAHSIISGRESDGYMDPRMLRQPFQYTSERFHLSDQTKYQATEVVNQDEVVQRSDVQRLLNLMENTSIEDSIWSAAVEHLVNILRIEGVSEECHCGSSDKEENVLLRLLAATLLKMNTTSTNNVISGCYDLLLVLVAQCTSCYKELTTMDILLVQIIPDVFHSNDQVRYSCHRLVLLLVYHPLRMVPPSSTSFMKLVDNLYLSSSSSLLSMMVVPVLHLPEIVVSTCDQNILSVMSSVVQQSFVPSTSAFKEEVVGCHPSHKTQRSYMLRYVQQQMRSKSKDGKVEKLANSLMQNVQSSNSHQSFIQSNHRLLQCCQTYPQIRNTIAAGTNTNNDTHWLHLYRRILRTSPTCDMDRIVLREVLKTLIVLIPSMSNSSLFAVSSLAKTTLLPLIDGSSSNSSRNNNNNVDSKEITPTPLLSRVDPYTHVGRTRNGKSGELILDVQVYSMKMLLELIRIVQKRSSYDLVQQTLLFISCETRMLLALSTTYNIDPILPCRTDATYLAYRTMVNLYLCSVRAIHMNNSTQPQQVLHLPSVVQSCLKFLSTSNFGRFNRSTLLRATTTLLCHAMKTGHGTMIMKTMLEQQRSIDVNREERLSLPKASPWYIEGCSAVDTTVRANAVYLSVCLETMDWFENCGRLFASYQRQEDDREEGVIQFIRRALSFVMARQQPPLVRAEALDAILFSMETYYRHVTEGENRGLEGKQEDKREQFKVTAIWLVQNIVVNGVLSDMYNESSLRCSASAARLSVYCTLTLKKFLPNSLCGDMSRCLFLEAKNVHQQMTLNSFWRQSLSSLFRNTYCGRERDQLRGNLLPIPVDVQMYSKTKQGNDIACSGVIIKTMHELWKDVHSKVGMEVEELAMLVLRCVVRERECNNTDRGTEKEEVKDYPSKYEEEEIKASYEKSISCGIHKILGYWNVIIGDKNNANTTRMIALMIQTTQMLSTLMVSLLQRESKKENSTFLSVDFVQLISLLELGIKSTNMMLSSSSSNLLWLLMESRPVTKNRVTRLLDVPSVTNVLVTQYMRTYTSSSLNKNDKKEKDQQWLRPLCSLLRLTLSSEVACKMGIIYFALRQLEECHRQQRNVLGVSTINDSRSIIQHMRVHYQLLSCSFSSSSVARQQCIQFDGAVVLQQSWSVIESFPNRFAASVVCEYLKVLTSLTQNNATDIHSSKFVHHDVFGVPLIDSSKKIGPFAHGAYHQGSQDEEAGGTCLLLPIRPVVSSQPASLLTRLMIFLMYQMNRVVENIENSTFITAYDMEVVQIGSSLLAQLGKDQPTAKILSRMPLVHNCLLLLRRVVSSSMYKSSKSSKSSKPAILNNLKKAKMIQICIINFVLSMSAHQSEHTMCFYSHNRKNGVDVHDILLTTWRLWCSSTPCWNVSDNELTLLGHLIRNLSMTNKSRFLAHPTLLEEILKGVLREDKPVIVACSSSILWAVSYNYKKIIPRMKRCNAELVFKRGLNILKRREENENKTNCTAMTSSYVNSMLSNAMQGLMLLSKWCESNRATKGINGIKDSP
jgi:hypothetical protein